ncbi:MAG: 23S rRNA (adenine(2503)-C(2))-methyltransferase RlmN [Oscillospiraceae bacterium]|nr:23S rRNA (adenine(2503)-C(2))-methyltransferase RlmN [Oscillospiraceae bacterium]MBQ9111415.1 23S rRNA (adenine(2503)-C(2))-methyltransferase RlmN [Oscillospiraceae bacterium]
MQKRDILSLNLEELTEAVTALGQPKYRAGQIYRWLHVKKVSDFSEMLDLPAVLRAQLDVEFCLKRLFIARRLESCMDNTVKYLYRLSDGQHVETVLMSYQHGWRLCISTQVGCKMGCQFCASTIAGYVRNLTPAEMLLQIDETERDAGVTISGIVLMGIGEPLDNYENVIRFLELLSDPKGRQMSLRHVTLSTCGIVPKIRELADSVTGLTLAVSLHNPTDAGRNAIMPVNRRYPLSELMEACRYYFSVTGRRVTYEYAVMQGENDSEADAKALADLLKGQQVHVNLIPVNSVKERSYHATRKAAQAFMQRLERHGVHATVRRTLGSDIEAACGQLRHEADRKRE